MNRFKPPRLRPGFRQVLALPLCLGLLVSAAPASAQDELPERTRIAVETLSRLQDVDLEKNPKLKAAVLKVLQATRGTPHYVKLIKQFHLAGHEQGLIEYATSHPTEEAGVEAIRLVLSGDDVTALRESLKDGAATNVVGLVEVLGHAKDGRAVPFLLPLMGDSDRLVAQRKAAVRALARTEAGSLAVLDLARNEKLPGDLRFTAASELAAVRWPEIKAAAAEILPLPTGHDAEPLPPLSTLLGINGDPGRGREVFQRELTQCSACHRVRGEGREVGPDLSEIGTKLGRDALFESILDPSAGVSFGYEAYELELKSGDEAFGLVVSETAEEVAVKDTQGIVTRYSKSDVVSRRQMKLSIMPAGLQMTMTTQELVDLVAYLGSLKKK